MLVIAILFEFTGVVENSKLFKLKESPWQGRNSHDSIRWSVVLQIGIMFSSFIFEKEEEKMKFHHTERALRV